MDLSFPENNNNKVYLIIRLNFAYNFQSLGYSDKRQWWTYSDEQHSSSILLILGCVEFIKSHHIVSYER